MKAYRFNCTTCGARILVRGNNIFEANSHAAQEGWTYLWDLDDLAAGLFTPLWKCATCGERDVKRA